MVLAKLIKRFYDVTIGHLMQKIEVLYKELNTASPKISNLEKLIKKSIEKLQKLSSIWASSVLNGKRVIQKCCFQREFSIIQKTMNI